MLRTYAEIEAIVDKFRNEHGLELGDLAGFVDATKVAVKAVDFVGKDEGKSGFIKREGDSYTIHVNVAHALTRQRFTIAHELGHYCLDHMQNKRLIVDDETVGAVLHRSGGAYSDIANPSDETVMEIEANRFAAALLMPKQLVERYWAYSPDIRFLASNFKVSEQAMRVRLQVLGLIV